MTNEEKFLVDLEGYLVIKDVLTPAEVDELNKIIDQGDRSGPSDALGCTPFTKLIDHPKLLPYLIELLGPTFRLDHDYAIFMSQGEQSWAAARRRGWWPCWRPRRRSLVQIPRWGHPKWTDRDDLLPIRCRGRCWRILVHSGESQE